MKPASADGSATSATPASFTRSDTNSQLETIWNALFTYRENLIPEGEPQNDEAWSEITTAMAFITEDLALE